MKVCCSCKKERLEEDFSIRHYKNGKTGLKSDCKECHNNKNKIWQKNNKSLYKENNSRRYRRTRDFLWELKSVPCSDCKTRYPPYVMDFDHVSGMKRFNLGECRRSIKGILEEVSKCDIVCANCHRERTHNRLNNKQE